MSSQSAVSRDGPRLGPVPATPSLLLIRGYVRIRRTLEPVADLVLAFQLLNNSWSQIVDLLSFKFRPILRTHQTNNYHSNKTR